MAKEIEIKFKIRDRQAFKRFLSNNNIVLSKPFTQHDIIFMRTGKEFCDLLSGEVILRIRQEAHKITTTAKRYIKGIQVREEIECKIDSVDKFTQYLRLLGFAPLVEVSKTRQQGNINNLTLTYDVVDELGDFVEIEAVSETDSSERVLKDILDTAKYFDFDESNIVNTPYDEMIYSKRKEIRG